MATDPREETLRLLRSIDATMRAILLVLSEKRNDAPPVNDSVCNGPHGDPVVKAKDPRDWSGPTMKGRTFSECPPDYLDMLADRYDYFATKDGADEKDVRYAKLDAQRARGWAARLRAGWTAPTSAEGGFTDGDF
jgi:hypothetical protein